MGDFFYSTLSYDRDKKNEREYRVQEGEPADTDLLHTDVVQLIGGRFFIGQNARRTFPLSVPRMYRMGRHIHRKNGCKLCSTIVRGRREVLIRTKRKAGDNLLKNSFCL